MLHKLRLSSITALAILVASAVPASAADIIVGLVTKTNTNPFFVKMKEGAEAKAKELGVKLSSFAGKVDGDNQSQVELRNGVLDVDDGLQEVFLVSRRRGRYFLSGGTIRIDSASISDAFDSATALGEPDVTQAAAEQPA